MSFELALSSMYADHHTWLVQWFRRRLLNIDQAADLSHDTFLKILLSPESEPIESPRGYLTVVARQLLVDQFRKRVLEQAYLDLLASLPEPQLPSEEYRAIVLESLYAIDAMLNELPAPIRSALMLSQIDGLTYDEIAKRLAVSVRTVKRYMAQAFEVCLIALYEQEHPA